MTRTIPILTCWLVVLWQTAPAFAQTDSTFKDRLGSGLLKGLYVATPVVQALDVISTMRVMNLGGRELNPLMAPIVSNDAAFVLTKSTIAFGEVYLARRMAKRNKFAVIGALAGLNVAYALFAAHNFNVAHRLQREGATPH